MGTAMKNNEYGSWLGVMTAAKAKIPTIECRRYLRSVLVFRTRAMSRNTSTTGNSNDSPNATIISEMNVRYLSAVKNGVSVEPPIDTRKFNAFGNVSQAT